MIDQAITIVGKGPTGATVLTIDDRGIVTGAGHVISSVETRVWPLLVGTIDSYVWTCIEGVWVVTGASTMCSVVGGASCAVDLMVCTSSQAPEFGTTQLSAVFDLTVTAPSLLNATLIAAPTQIFPGMSIAIDLDGTQTGLVACLTFNIKRLS